MTLFDISILGASETSGLDAEDSIQAVSRYSTQERKMVTTIKLYNVTVIATKLYASETWQMLEAHNRKLDAFQRCPQRILGVSWWDKVTNAGVPQRTGQHTLKTMI